MNSKNLLLIFTRNPELGKCKTRLAATIGDEAALDIYKFLLRHTASITHNLEIAKEVWYSETIWENDVWNNSNYEKKLQSGHDLGERMAQAFTEGFKNGFERIVIIGSDMYDLTQKDLKNAFTLLEKHDFVVGPAEDGGYYLLGMTRFEANLFKEKQWGTSSVLKNTLSDLEKNNYVLLQERNDIDLYEEVEKDKKAILGSSFVINL